jgi:protein involved in polysaccharide export with SLBB domain
MFRFMKGQDPLHVATPALAWFAVLLVCGACFSPVASATGEDARDFPPLVDPNRPVGGERSVAPAQTPAVTPADTTGHRAAAIEAESEPYLLGVGDELKLTVLSSPELSGVAKVRPDGAATFPGAGTLHVLGRTPEEVGRELEEKLGGILRYPRVDLAVTSFGEPRIFVMGEVPLPGDKPYYKGMSALQAVAAAGGFLPSGKSSSVLVLRRTGSDAAEVRQLDLGLSLKGKPGPGLALHPYDIVFVPRTMIARANVAVDQYVRQMIAPFTLYLEGWRAWALATGKVKVVATL